MDWGNAHAKSTELFATLRDDRENLYFAVASSSDCNSKYDYYEDRRLQNTLWNIWKTFSRLSGDSMEKGSSYIVRQALLFKVVCDAGQPFFSCQYTGTKLQDCPCKVYENVMNLEENQRGGRGLAMGRLPEGLAKVGDSLVFRLKKSQPLHSAFDAFDEAGILRPGLWVPTQFYLVKWQGEDLFTGKRHYLITYIAAPIKAS